MLAQLSQVSRSQPQSHQASPVVTGPRQQPHPSWSLTPVAPASAVMNRSYSNAAPFAPKMKHSRSGSVDGSGGVGANLPSHMMMSGSGNSSGNSSSGNGGSFNSPAHFHPSHAHLHSHPYLHRDGLQLEHRDRDRDRERERGSASAKDSVLLMMNLGREHRRRSAVDM